MVVVCMSSVSWFCIRVRSSWMYMCWYTCTMYMDICILYSSMLCACMLFGHFSSFSSLISLYYYIYIYFSYFHNKYFSSSPICLFHSTPNTCRMYSFWNIFLTPFTIFVLPTYTPTRTPHAARQHFLLPHPTTPPPPFAHVFSLVMCHLMPQLIVVISVMVVMLMVMVDLPAAVGANVPAHSCHGGGAHACPPAAQPAAPCRAAMVSAFAHLPPPAAAARRPACAAAAAAMVAPTAPPPPPP